MLKRAWNWLRSSRISTRLREVGFSYRSKSTTETRAATTAEYKASALLEQGAGYWRTENWVALSRLADKLQEPSPEKGVLAVLSAVAHSNLGNNASARRLLHEAARCGRNKDQIACVLIGQIHKELGRAAAAINHNARAEMHFNNAHKLTCADDQLRNYGIHQ